MPTLRRRTLLQLSVGSLAVAGLLPWQRATARPAGTRAFIEDGLLAIALDARLHTQLARGGEVVTAWSASETLQLQAGPLADFAFVSQQESAINDPQHGPGRRLAVLGRAPAGIEKRVEITLFQRHPGLAIVQSHYRNCTAAPLAILGWQAAAHGLAQRAGGFWSYSGATHEDRRDWVRPVAAGFEQRNSLGMTASDYGGGTPVAYLWRRDVGLAVGHVEPRPVRLELPVAGFAGEARIAVASSQPQTLAPDASFSTPRCFLSLHTGDHFNALVQYRGFMAAEGIAARPAPASAFAPIWCAWGYERNFTPQQVLDTLPKVRELGLEWVVLDDGWQTNEGDWALNPHKFPNGDADMRALVAAIRKQGLRPRLWLAPLAADPGSDVLHDHPDMLLLDKDGSFQKVSWWNALTQCPAYPPTIAYYVALVQKIIGDWGFEGLKLDGQHLNAVAPCYNPAHQHASPEDACTGLPAFWEAIHRAAHAANPNAVVELCPCGTSFAFHNLPATDQYPASDPLSSWQVRHKGKTVKALMGAGSSYAGDHVELSDHGHDFASSFGVGAVLSTKFTWPEDTRQPIDTLPPGGFVLTPAKEVVWKKWLALYRQHMLPHGDYLGGLYDIGFDRPETHAIRKDGKLYYAFHAERWAGPVALRGLGTGRYRVDNLFTGAALGVIEARQPRLEIAFEDFMLLIATPLEPTA